VSHPRDRASSPPQSNCRTRSAQLAEDPAYLSREEMAVCVTPGSRRVTVTTA
jgi:hypothetical protein